MDDRSSDRLVDQRIRNRIMEAVETLADGDDGVRSASFQDYFENFYDHIPHRGDGGIRDNAAITGEERALLQRVSETLDDACDATSRDMTEEDFIATGWPKRIQPVALETLNVMRARGRFSEKSEESTLG